MQVDYINPFLSATTNVFRTMLACEISRGPVAIKSNRAPQYEVSGLIGLTGKCQGMVVVSLGRDTAIRAAETLLGQPLVGLDAQVVDAVGELANMIAGAAKAQLEQYELSVGLPSVICGKNHSINFPSNSTPIVLPFESTIGPICIEIGLANTAAVTPSVAV